VLLLLREALAALECGKALWARSTLGEFMTDKKKPKPDYGSSLVWSTETGKAMQAGVATLLRKHGGNVDEALKSFFLSGGTSYSEGRELSIYARYFGLTEAEFQTKHRHWKRGEPLTGKGRIK
jgi:hypothetical protein